MTPAIPEPVARLLEAANDHDTEAFLASFTDEGVVDDWGREVVGAETIRGWSDREFIGVDAVLGVTGRPSSGDETTISARSGGQGLQRAEPLHLRSTGRPRCSDD